MVTLAFDEYGLSITDLHAIWGEHIYGIEGGKKVFPMTPIHHSFEKWGFNEPDIVRLFYVIGFILGASAIVYGVWI